MVGSGLGGIVAPPSPEEVAEAVAKVFEAHYDRDFMPIRWVEIFNEVASRG